MNIIKLCTDVAETNATLQEAIRQKQAFEERIVQLDEMISKLEEDLRSLTSLLNRGVNYDIDDIDDTNVEFEEV